MFKEYPHPELLRRIDRAIVQNRVPTETDLVQMVMLGRELYFHYEFADMAYVESKTTFSQLDKGRGKTYNWLQNVIAQLRVNLDEYDGKRDAGMVAEELMSPENNDPIPVA